MTADEIKCPSDKAALEEYRSRIHEMTGDEHMDILINGLKEEGTLSKSFKPNYEKIRSLVEKRLLRDHRGRTVPSRPLLFMAT